MAEGMSDIFLQLVTLTGTPVKGESQDSQFSGQIELNSFSLKGPSFSRKKKKKADKKKKQGKDEEEKPKTFSFNITKDVDNSTPILVQTYSKNLGVNAEPYSQAVIRLRLPHVQEHLVFLEFTFTGVHLTKYDLDLDGETNIPTEKLEFAFKALDILYSPQTNTGGASSMMMTATWPPPSSGK